MASISDDGLLLEFIAEGKEHLAAIEPDLLTLEQTVGNVEPEIINRIFRAIHSIKGASGFFGFEALKNLSHAMESVLVLIRDGKMQLTAEIIDVLLVGVDKLRTMFDDIHASDTVPYGQIVRQLEIILDAEKGSSLTEPITLQAQEPVKNEKIQPSAFDVDRFSMEVAMRNGQHVYLIHVKLDSDLTQKSRTPLDFVQHLGTMGSLLDSLLDITHFPDLATCLETDIPLIFLYASVLDADLLQEELQLSAEQLQSINIAEWLASDITASTGPVPLELEIEEDAPSPNKLDSKQKLTSVAPENTETIRVRVDLLNRLMDLAGELVLSRNQLNQILLKEINHIRGLHTLIQGIDLVTTDLQEHIMQTRMQPIGSIFGKFPRVVRDLSKQLGKDIQLKMSGEDVELDKSILESLSDPLTHLIRNCCDHAIETPDERRRIGKSETGSIMLLAYHEGGQINVVIKDDGRGIDSQNIARKALEKGLVTETELQRMSAQEMLNLIFLPGLSTAEKVSDVSGRGVGMDVVRNNIEKMSGHISVESVKGQGTKIQLRLPLTLAIISSLIVGVSDQKFAIPQINVVELVCVRAHEISTRIEKVGSASVLRLRGNLLPLVRLSDVLELESSYVDELTGENQPDRRQEVADIRLSEESDVLSENRRWHPESDYHILVLRSGGNQYGLIVDDIYDSEEIVVKPLSAYLKNTKCFSGATIMGDGRVAMILDIGGIQSHAGLSFIEHDSLEPQGVKTEDSTAEGENRQALILFTNAVDEFFALPLSSILRLERFDTSLIERVGSREFLNYRGKGLPLVRLENLIPVGSSPNDMRDAVLIIPKAGNGAAGIVVSRIVDTLEADVSLEKSLIEHPGVLGSAIISEHLSLFLEPEELLISSGILPYKKLLGV
jgi:two-component system chemotaxis sensor kinase CheA